MSFAVNNEWRTEKHSNAGTGIQHLTQHTHASLAGLLPTQYGVDLNFDFPVFTVSGAGACCSLGVWVFDFLVLSFLGLSLDLLDFFDMLVLRNRW